MALIDDLRQQNPKLQNLSDRQIADSLRRHPDFQGLDENEFNARVLGQQNQPQNQPQGDRGKLGLLWDGVRTGGNQLQAITGGAASFAGDLLDQPGMVDYGREVYERNMAEAEETTLGYEFTDLFSDENTSVADWAIYNLGQMAPMMAGSLVPGFGGGVVGAAGSRLLGGVAKVGAKRLGQAIGAAAGSYGMAAGEIMGETNDAGVTAAHAPIMAALDTVVPIKALRALGRGDVAGKAAKEISDGVLDSLRRQAERGVLRTSARGGLLGLVGETSTEGLQNLIEQHASYWADNNESLLLEATQGNLGAIDWKAMINEGAAAAPMGTVMGVPTGLGERGQARQKVQQIEAARRDAAAQGGDALDQTIASQEAEQDAEEINLDTPTYLRQQQGPPRPPAGERPSEATLDQPAFERRGQQRPEAIEQPLDANTTGQRLQEAMTALDELQGETTRSGFDGQVRLRNANRLLDNAEKAFQDGDYERAERLLQRADGIAASLRDSLPRQPSETEQQGAPLTESTPESMLGDTETRETAPQVMPEQTETAQPTFTDQDATREWERLWREQGVENPTEGDFETIDIQPGAPETDATEQAGTRIEQEQQGAAGEPITQRPAVNDQQEEDPGSAQRVPTERIQIDPDAYQFRTDVDQESGTDSRLEGVQQWDDYRAGNVLIHEREDGSLFVADGHHRVRLAQELGQPVVNAQIVRERDGVTVQDARRMAAENNIANDSATSLDVAKVFRDKEGSEAEIIAEANLPPRSTLARDGIAISRLGDEAFGAVVNGQLDEKSAAVIGRTFSDPAEQLAAVGVFQRANPTNDTQRTLLANEIRNAGFDDSQGDQLGMFGDDPAESLIGDRVRVLDNLRGQLVRDRRLFATLNRNAPRAEAAGNQINTEANQQQSDQSARAIDLLGRVSTDPDLNQAVNDAARRVRDGEPMARVVDELKTRLTNGRQSEDAPQGDQQPADGRPAVRRGQEPGRGQQGAQGDADGREGQAEPGAPDGQAQGLTFKKDGSPFATEQSALASGVARRARAQGQPVEAVPSGNGFGVRVVDQQPSEGEPQTQQSATDEPQAAQQDFTPQTEGASVEYGYAGQREGFRIRSGQAEVTGYVNNADFPGDSASKTRGELFLVTVPEGQRRRGTGTSLAKDSISLMTASGAQTVNISTTSAEGRRLVGNLMAEGVISEPIRTSDTGKAEYRITAAQTDVDAADTPSDRIEGTPDNRQDDDFLETQTEESLAAREREQQQAQQAEADQRRQEEQRAQADAEVDDFRLAGSDRPADVLSSGGQQDLMEPGDARATGSSTLREDGTYVGVPSDLSGGQRGEGVAQPRGGRRATSPTQGSLFDPVNLPKAQESTSPRRQVATEETARAQVAGNFKVRYELSDVGSIPVGIRQVSSVEDVAHVVAPFRKHGQETMLALVTDDDGNVLQLIRHTKGARSAASVYVDELVTSTTLVPDGTKVWLAHNHPSGTAEPSPADYKITDRIVKALDASGVEFQGHVIAVSGGEFVSFGANAAGANDYRKITPTPANRKQSLGIGEKVLRRRDSLTSRITMPSHAKEAANEFLPDQSGLLLLNTQHYVMGALPLSQPEMLSLRDGGAQRIMKALATSNADAVISVTRGEGASFNVSAFLANLDAEGGNLRHLDSLVRRDDGRLESLSDKGSFPFSGIGSETFFAMAGQRAETADTHSLDRAQAMLAQGHDGETVRRETGWFIGADGKPRFEIDDSDARFLPFVDKSAGELWTKPLEEVLDHPKLFAAYPGLRDVDVVSARGMGTRHGQMNSQKREIMLNADRGAMDQFSTLLHEVQHGIQHIEGFATGGDPASYRLPPRREQWLRDKVQELTRESGDFARDVLERYKAGEITSDQAQQRIQQRADEIGLNELRQKLREGNARGAYRYYQRLYGETEARNVQARQSMTEAERSETPPSETQDVPDSDVVLVYNGQEMADAPEPANAADMPQGARPTVTLADDVSAALEGVTELGDVQVVQTVNDLPAGVRDSMSRQSINGRDVRGVYVGDELYVVADSVRSVQEGIEVAVHEAVGHKGIRGVLGADLDRVMQGLYRSLPNSPEGRQALREVRQAYPFLDPSKKADQIAIAEEMVAHLLEKGHRPKAWQRAVAKIRELLRRAFPMIAWTYTDVLALGEKSRDYLRRQQAERQGDSGESDIRFSLRGKQRAPFESQFDDFTDADRAAESKIGSRTPPQRAMEWFKEKADRAGLKIRQGMVDRVAALKELDEQLYGESAMGENITRSSWVLARMSGAANGALHALLHNGRIRLDEDQKVITLQEGDAKGLGEVLGRLGSGAEIERFMGWIAGNRAARLAGEGRENLFDVADIEAMQGWNRGQMADGRSREATYQEVFEEFQTYRDDVLSVAEQSGIISSEQREMWAEEFYVPFYRIAEDNNGQVSGMMATSGLSRQQAYKRLKGGTQNLNDLLQNTMMNFHHLLDASLKNQAAVQAVENANQLGMVERVPESNRDTKKSTFVMEGGKKVFYEIDDPLVFQALTALAHPGMNSTAMKVMRGFKRVFTNLTTTTPQFMVANLIRDSLQATATNNVSKNALKNVFDGAGAYRDQRTRAQMMASGASFNFGHLYGNNPDELRSQLTRNMRDAQLVDGPYAVPNVLRKGWAWWNDLNNTAENVSRAAIYSQNRESGELRAAFESRDLIDFSAHGAWPAVRILIDIVPFLNARIQGLDKIYRSGVKPGASVVAEAFGYGNASVTDKQAAARFWTVTGALAVATIALYLHNQDDEEYQKLEDWQKDSYWFFRAGDQAFFIPKPFEVGAIATMAERITEQFTDDQATGKLFRQRMMHMMTDTFSFSPVPQAVQPALDIYANYDAFTQRPIESMGMDRLSPELRRRANTSKAGEWISSALNNTVGAIGNPETNPLALSPVQVDHLIGGYLGQVGTWVASSGDVAWSMATGKEDPARRWYEYQPVRRFYRNLGDEDRYTRYSTIFYEGLREAGRAYADVKELREMGRLADAAERAESNREMLGLRLPLNRAQRRIGKINKQIDIIRRSSLDGEIKRQRIDRLREVKNQIQRALGERVMEARTR